MHSLNAKQYPPLVRWAVTNTIKTRLWFADISDQDLDDMFQEAWIAITRYRDKPQGYQFKAARHAVLNYYYRYVLARKNSRKPENARQPSIWENCVSLEQTLNEKGEETLPHQPADERNDTHRPHLPLQGPALQAFLQSLYTSFGTSYHKRGVARSEKDALLLLLLSQGYTNEGIAQEMGCNANTVRARRRHLRMTLEAELRKELSR